MNENDAYLFDVEEPQKWVFDGSHVLMKGWFISKQDAIFSDLRVVIDGIAYMGHWGLPRPEIEAQYRLNKRLPHAGFECLIRPPAGSKLIQLQLRDAGGNWVEIWRQKIKVTRGPRRKAKLKLEIVPDQLRKLLQQRRSQPEADLSSIAETLAVESSAHFETRTPISPFFGALEKPILTAPSQYGKINIEGWIVHRDLKIKRLIATTNPLVVNELDYGNRGRPEITARFADNPHAKHPQFFGMVDIDEAAGEPAYLQIFAELENGDHHLVFSHRFHQLSSTEYERPLPTYSQKTFWALARLFAKSCQQQKIQIGGLRTYYAACKLAQKIYLKSAPTIIPQAGRDEHDPYSKWQSANHVTPALKRVLLEAIGDQSDEKPKFVALIDTRDCRPEQLRQIATSLQSQLYTHWEAWFVGTSSMPLSDDRIHAEKCANPKAFVSALNHALSKSSGSHLCYLSGHSLLSVDAFLEIAICLDRNPTLELVYTDEDRISEDGKRHTPSFKPEWSPAMSLSGLFPGNLSVVRKERVESLGGFREPYSKVIWYDTLLRLGDDLVFEDVTHIPLICHHTHESIAAQTDLADISIEQSRKALNNACKRRQWNASALLPESAHHRQQNYHQLRWDPKTLEQLPVTIVIPTRDRLHLLQECVELLDETVNWSHAKLIIVDDFSRDADIVSYLAAIQQRADLHCKVVQPPDPQAPFNYSKLVNTALPHIDTPLILHLNNDVNALEQGWLEEMTGWFTQEDVGIVGAKLVYPKKTLNHTGIIIGPHGGLADTPFAKDEESSVDTIWHAIAREVSAVTGACLMTRTSLYQELNGFDEKDFGVAYNDVDYCLRVRGSGHRVIYTPQAKLMHWGSATRGVTFNEAEHIAFLKRYPGYIDPYFSPNWELHKTRIRCTGSRNVRAERIGKLHVLIITHNLNLEGAPLFILEYARWLVRKADFTVEVLSAQDGPLRSSFEEVGAEITLTNVTDLYGAEDEEIFHSRLADISHKLDWERIDLVVCNTLANFWGVHLSRLGGCPSLFYIHESTSIHRFFERSLNSKLMPLVSAAFADCTRALFLCQATRDYYEDLNVSGSFQIVPSWIELDRLDQYRATCPRDQLRGEMGYKDDEIIIANIGTVCERKGQHVFIRAIEHFNRQHADGPKVRFVLVGARPGIYLDLLNRDIANLGITNLSLVPETQEVFDHFIAADMFVCTSYEESFPRVIMEAMALRTPIVSTDVHGIPDLVQQRADAYLVPPGDPIAFARMMWTCIAKERSGKSLAPTAYSKIMRYQDYQQILPKHVIIAQETALIS